MATTDPLRIHLQDIFQAGYTDPSNILRAVLKESKSLPRETDMNPTSPRPDQPSAPQERLLEVIREEQRWARTGMGKGKERDSGVGLDGLEEFDGGGGGQEEEEYTLLKETIQGSFPRVSPVPVLSSGNPEESIFADNTKSISTSTDIPEEGNTTSSSRLSHSPSRSKFLHRFSFSDSGSPSHPTPKNKTHHRRTSSAAKEGETKQFYNLISFLAFLTKEQLLLHPGTGERVAVEMISDTLHLHHSSPSHQNQHQTWTQEMGYTHTPWFGAGDEMSITAISLILIIMGEELYQRSCPSTRSRFNSTKDGDLARLVSDNWETWRTRLQFLSLREDLSISAREQAAEAAAVMGRV
ncbi:hypothetical protein BDV12DRAFT_165615 [Aspergillus spectabilis]